MSWSFPLAGDDFFGTLKLASCLLRASFGQETSGLGSGSTIVKDLRPPLWLAAVETGKMLADEFNDLSAWVEILGEGRGSFLAWDTKKQFPRADPDGSILGLAEPEIDSRSGNFDLAIGGLPAGYQLSFSDLLGVFDGASYRLHRIAEPAVADGSGVTPLFSVVPKLSAATIAGLAVTLVRPPVALGIVPGTFEPRPGQFHTVRTATFQAEQRFGTGEAS